MGLHPKSLYKERGTKGRKKVTEKDKEILFHIKRLIKNRPTYGYKRVTAMYNRERRQIGLSVYNKKCVYRIMKENALLFPQSERSKESHKGTGKNLQNLLFF